MLLFITLVGLIAAALASVIIKTYKPAKAYTALITLVAGIFVGFISEPVTTLAVTERLYAGFIAGLVAAGALSFDSLKAILVKKSTK